MRWLSLLVPALLLGSAGCSSNNTLSTDPNVFVEAKVQYPLINVSKKSVIDLELTGGFTLTLHLGPRASGTADVDLQGFSLISEDQNTVIVDSLSLTAKGETLPIKVEPDSDEELQIVIDPTALKQEDATKLCSFGTARYKGSLTDSLKGGTQPVVTGPVTVAGTGCTGP